MLDANQIRRVTTFVALAKARAEQADALAPNVVEGAWAWLIGASSTASAQRTDVAGSWTLYEAIKAKADEILSNPYATELDVRRLESGEYALGNEALQATAEQLSSDAFFDQVVAPTVDTLGKPLGVPLWVWGAAVVTLVLIARR